MSDFEEDADEHTGTFSVCLGCPSPGRCLSVYACERSHLAPTTVVTAGTVLQDRHGFSYVAIPAPRVEPALPPPVQASSPALEEGGRAYYKKATMQVADVWEAFEMDPCSATAFKYLARHGDKEGADPVTDLTKAIWYIRRRIEQLERERARGLPRAKD